MMGEMEVILRRIPARVGIWIVEVLCNNGEQLDLPAAKYTLLSVTNYLGHILIVYLCFHNFT